MDGAGPPGEAPVSRHGASRTWHTSCSLEAQLAGYRALRFTDAQTPGFRVLTWQVWATNQASGCTALCVLAPFTPSQGREGWGEATAKLWGGSCTVSSNLSSKEPPAGAEWGGGEGTGTQITFSQGKRGALEGVVQRRQVTI